VLENHISGLAITFCNQFLIINLTSDRSAEYPAHMPIIVAEYLGVRTDNPQNPPSAIDSQSKPDVSCPFRDGGCSKAAKGLTPVCSIKDASSGQVWIVCEHRLCATQPRNAKLNEYQRTVLSQIGELVFPGVPENEIAIRREARVRRTPGQNRSDDSKADYLMVQVDSKSGNQVSGSRGVILEMQGGGETSNTQLLSNQVRKWEKSGVFSDLVSPVGIRDIATNAWRRQQEQFLFKGNVAHRSNGRLVFVMGEILYDKVMGNIQNKPAPITLSGGWTLALLGIVEGNGTNAFSTGESLSFEIDINRTLITDYGAFARALTDQGQYDPELFHGEFETLGGVVLNLS
jgi:hypothetical protein